MIKINELKTEQALKKMNIHNMTPIQTLCFQPIFARKNLIMQAPTGTGKTLAYLLPIFEKTIDNQVLQTVIVAPTRELVMQIVSVIRELDGAVVALIGGANMKRQLVALKAKPNFVVGTPDRLHELIQNRRLKIHTIDTIVLDEFDEMYRQKQWKKISAIVLSALRQTAILAVSATVSKEAANTLTKLRSDFQILSIQDEIQGTEKLQYYYIVVDWNKRKDTLRRFFVHLSGKTLVFSNDRFLLQIFHEQAEKRSAKISVLHSQMDKMTRANRIHKFRSGNIQFLLSTDLTARGMDIPDLENVIHVDLPENAQQWKHRNGRVGRMGQAGNIYFIVPKTEKEKFHRLMAKNNIRNYQKFFFDEKRESTK